MPLVSHAYRATPWERAASFDGIGVQFNMADDTLFVIQTVSKGPSEKVGILPGDRIVTVNDTAIAGVKMEREEIMKRLRGPKGSVVQLGVVRRGYDEHLMFRVTRDKIYGTVDCSPLHRFFAKIWLWMRPVRRFPLAIFRRIM